MKIQRLVFWVLFLSVAGIISCDKGETVPTAVNERTLFMYMPWSTNLTDYFYNNIADMEKAISQEGLDGERVLVFLSTSPLQAELFEIVCDDGACTRNVLKEYESPEFTTEEGLTAIIGDVKAFAPAPNYAMIIGCHGMGWLPVETGRGRSQEVFRYHWDYPDMPMTRFFGGLSSEYQTDVTTLARSIADCGLKMDYILFDDCYMSSLEVAYDLRHVTDYLIACPTEVMVYGMPYATMGPYLLSARPDYEAVCNAFYQFYSNYRYPYGTLAVTDCSKLDDLAGMMKQIHLDYEIDPIKVKDIQRMDGYSPVIFYDFGDYVRTLCSDDAEIMARFNALMDEVVPYKVHTEKFYTASRGPLSVGEYSGITTSEPSTNLKAQSYLQTSWYRDTH